MVEPITRDPFLLEKIMSTGFISRTFFDSEPIIDFPEDFKKRKDDEFKELKKKIKSKEYVILWGRVYNKLCDAS